MKSLNARVSINPVSKSYIIEALDTFNSNCYKASAVMVGCAAESISLEIRNALVNKLNSLGRTIPNNLNDWRIRTVLQAIQTELDNHSRNMPRTLREQYDSYWPAFTQQIRAVRNDAGHPTNLDPVTFDSVHGALLIFPELAALGYSLLDWISNNLA